jgi:thiol:disulfide interchange protein
VLRLNPGGDGVIVAAAPGTVPTGGEPVATTSTAPTTPALGWLLLAALAGGLLLNVMPCVFPILSLKALSLARAGESQTQARAEGLAYTAGVVVACLALGALLLGLRAAGQEVGWAFQLQEPLVVAALLSAGQMTFATLMIAPLAIAIDQPWTPVRPLAMASMPARSVLSTCRTSRA